MSTHWSWQWLIFGYPFHFIFKDYRSALEIPNQYCEMKLIVSTIRMQFLLLDPSYECFRIFHIHGKYVMQRGWHIYIMVQGKRNLKNWATILIENKKKKRILGDHARVKYLDLWPIKLTWKMSGMLVLSTRWEQLDNWVSPQILMPKCANHNKLATLYLEYVTIFLTTYMQRIP